MTLAVALSLCVLICASSTPARAQSKNPVYFDDSATAADALSRVRELAGIGNTDEAVRVLQAQLLTSAEKLVVSPDDPDLYIPVRDRVHAMLSGDGSLLARYTDLNAARARRELESGNPELVERAYLMTTAGVRAALRLAQRHMESARFHAAWHTLAQLDGHPLVEGELSERRAQLARTIISYIDDRGLTLDESDRALARRWAERVDLEPLGVAVETPEIDAAITPEDRMASIDVEGLLPKPLWSVDLGARLDVSRVRSRDTPEEGIPEHASLLYMVPAVDEDSIYVNDGFTITSLNRFSLSERWQTAVREPSGRRLRSVRGRTFDDPSTIEVSGRWAVAVTGLSVANNDTERAIVALDSRTGEVLWRRTIGDLELTDLGTGRIVGQPVIDQRTVIATVVKDAERRRLHSIYAVAIDLVSGEPMWSRPLGSVGKLPYGNSLYNADLPTVEGGIMYRSDRIGFMIAIQTVTGRVQWARRFDYRQRLRRYVPQSMWEMNRPVIRGEKMYTINPERTLLHTLDTRTGAVLEQHPSAPLGKPNYLLVSDGVLIGVNAIDLFAAPLDRLGDEDAYSKVLTVPDPGIRGRVVASDERIVVPTVDGVLQGDPSSLLDGGAEFERVELDSTGTVLPMDQELLVLDDRRMHTYLLWESAREVLTARMEADPDDASSPVTFAELAYRAGRTDLVVEATDRALRAIERDPLSLRNESARARLFGALLDMVDPPADTPTERTFDPEQKRDLIARLELCASTPRERVAYLMAKGSIAQSTDEPRRAVDAYQRVLQTDDLASTMYFDDSRSVPADAEATRRLRSLIELYSRDIYRPYDREASRELESIADTRDPGPFEALARRYPVAVSAPRAWRAAAERYEQRGRRRYATDALDRALRVSRRIDATDPALETRIAGELVSHFIDTNHYDRALELLMRYDERGLLERLDVEGSAPNGAALLERVRESIDRRDQRPRIGEPQPDPEPIVGWALLSRPRAMREAVPTDRVPMISSNGEIAVFGIDGDGRFGKLWGGVEQSRERLIRFSDAGALFATRDDPSVLDRSFTMRDIDTGDVLWKTRPFYTQFDKSDLLDVGHPSVRDGAVPRFDTPLRTGMRSTMLVHATTPRTLVVVGVSGLAAAYDMESGAMLWRERLDINRVHDVSVDGSTFAVGGIVTSMSLEVQSEDEIGLAPGVHTMELRDVRTGVRMGSHDESSAVRWLTLSSDGDVIAGTNTSIIAYAPTRSAPLWRKAQVEGLERTLRAWAMPGRLLVQGENGPIWQLDARTGERRTDPLIGEDAVSGNWSRNLVTRLGENICISVKEGLRLYAPSGEMIGRDVRSAAGEIIPPAYAETRIVSISEDEVPTPDDPSVNGFELTLHEAGTLKLATDPVTVGFGMGHDSPDAIAVIDGKIIVSSGAVTYAIDAPADPAP